MREKVGYRDEKAPEEDFGILMALTFNFSLLLGRLGIYAKKFFVNFARGKS